MPDSTKPISRRLRFEILRRDEHTCRYCGAQAPDVPITVDHVIPRALGGTDDPTNLVTACRDCNFGKGSTSPDAQIVADVDAKAFQWAAAIERAAELRRVEIDAENEILGRFYNYWSQYVGADYLPNTWRGGIKAFIARGLTIDEIENYVLVAVTGPASFWKMFNYMCGCCWNEIGRREELARQIIDGET